MAKYHINDQGEVHPCRASKKPCRFGGADGASNHYTSREAATAALEAQLKAEHEVQSAVHRKAAAARRVPEVRKWRHFAKLPTQEQVQFAYLRAALLPDAHGKPFAGVTLGAGQAEDSYYKGAVLGRLEAGTYQLLEDHGVFEAPQDIREQRRKAQGLAPEGWQERLTADNFALVPSTLRELTSEHFADTYSPPIKAHRLEVTTVVTCPDGHRVEVPLTLQHTYPKLLEKALEEGKGQGLTPTAEEALRNRARGQEKHLEREEAEREAERNRRLFPSDEVDEDY